MTTLFSILLLATKYPVFVTIAKPRNMVRLCEVVAIRRRVGGTGSTGLSAFFESYDWRLRKRNVGGVYNC